MKRNEIVEKLMSEGFSQNTLVNMSDRQLGLLSSRFLGEQTATFAPTNANSPKVKVNTKDPNVKRKVTDANKAGLTPELEETALKGLGNPRKVEPKESAMPGLSKPKKVEPKESAMPGLSKPKKVEPKESAMPGLSKPKKVEPKEEALKGLGNPRKVEPKESAMPGLSNPKKQEPKEEALKGLGNPRKVEPKESAMPGLSNPKKQEPKEEALKGLGNPRKVEPKESAMPGLSKPKKVEPKESAMPGLSNPKKVEPKEQNTTSQTKTTDGKTNYVQQIDVVAKGPSSKELRNKFGDFSSNPKETTAIKQANAREKGKKIDTQEDVNFYDITNKLKNKSKKSVLEKEVDECNVPTSQPGKEKKEIKEWVEKLVKNDYHCITTKNEIMELIEAKMMEQSPDVDVPVKEPKTRPDEKPGIGKPDTGRPLHNPWKKDLPNVQPGPKFNSPDVDAPVKEPKTTPTEKPGVGKPDTGKPLHNPWKKDLPNVQPGPKFRGEPTPKFLSKNSIMGAVKQNQVNEISSRILQSIKNGKKNI